MFAFVILEIVVVIPACLDASRGVIRHDPLCIRFLRRLDPYGV